MKKLFVIIIILFSGRLSNAQKPIFEIGPELKEPHSQFEFRFLKTNGKKIYSVQRILGFAGGRKFEFREIFEIYDCENLKNLLSAEIGKKGIVSATMQVENLVLTDQHAILIYSYYDKGARAKKLVADVYDMNEKIVRKAVELMSDPEGDDEWKTSYFVAENEKTHSIAAVFAKKKRLEGNPQSSNLYKPEIKIKTFTKELVLVNEKNIELKKSFVPLSFYFSDDGNFFINGNIEQGGMVTEGTYLGLLVKINLSGNGSSEQFFFGSSLKHSFSSLAMEAGRFIEDKGSCYFFNAVKDKESESGMSIYAADLNNSTGTELKEKLYPVTLNTSLFKNKKESEKALENIKVERIEKDSGNIFLIGEQAFAFQLEKNQPYQDVGNIAAFNFNWQTGKATSNVIFHKGYISSQDYIQGVYWAKKDNTVYFFFNDSPKNKSLIAGDLKQSKYEYYKNDMVTFYVSMNNNGETKKIALDKSNIKNSTHEIAMLPSLTKKINDHSYLVLVRLFDEEGYLPHFAKLTFE